MEIPNFENYLIYDDGRVFNQQYNRFLKCTPDEKGYPRVSLCNNGVTRVVRVHQLVAENFINNPFPEKYDQVDHIDRNRANNNVVNLRWVDKYINAQNKNVYKNNKLGVKNIFTYRNDYVIDIMNRGVKKRKTMSMRKYTLDEVVRVRDQMLTEF